MPSPQPARSLAAIVFTDIAGYSKLVHRDDARGLKLLAEHFRLVREAARRFDGREIKTIGDSVHLEFASAQAATTCAIAIQQLHQQRNARVGADDRFEIRIGLHLGDIEHRDGDVYGDGVNIAARLQPLAPVGGIAISDDVRRQLPEDLRHRFTSRGAQDLKNIDTPVQVFVIEVPAIAEISVDAPARAPASARAKSVRLPPAWALITVGVIALMMFIAKPWRYGPDGTERRETVEAQDKSIAVLPFESLSEDKANAFFAEGIQDQILTGLAKIGDLKVISRTSTQRYASRPDNLSQIARELGVAHILEGSVQRSGNRVRINVQLIHARDDSHLWADTFDRTLDDIFAVQSEVAQKIADTLSATITQRERAAISQKPTENPQAYAAYLKGRALFTRGITTRAQADVILDPLRQAVKLDPGFALAWADLSRAAILCVWTGLDPSGDLADEAEEALDRAIALAPKLPQVELARAINLYYADRDFAGAAEVVSALKAELPGEAEIWITDGLLARRLGKWDQAIASLEHARTLQPQDASLTYNLGVTRASTFQFQRAIETMDAVLTQQPDDPNALSAKFEYLVLMGELPKAAQFLAGTPVDAPIMHALRGTLAVYQHDDATASQHLQLAIASNAEDRLDAWFDGYIPALVEWKLMLGACERRRGNAAAAKKLFEEVKAQATTALGRKLETRYVEADWQFALAMALAALGESEEAIAHAQSAMATVPASGDKAEAPQFERYLAIVHALNADAAHAVPIAQRLVQTPSSFLTRALLRVDPWWNAVREDPGFQALLKEP